MVLVYKNCYEHIGVVYYTTDKCPECEKAQQEAFQNEQAVEHTLAPDGGNVCAFCGTECGDKPYHIFCDPAATGKA